MEQAGIEMRSLNRNASSSPLLGCMTHERAAKKREALESMASKLKLIESLKWNNVDGQDPLSVFSRELWEEILQYLVDPDELKNAIDTCPLFKDILEVRRIRDVLMPFALKVKEFRKTLKKERTSPQMTPMEFCNISEPLQLRAVCKSWRYHFDKCLEYSFHISNFVDEDTNDWLPYLKLKCPTPNVEQWQFLFSAIERFNPERENHAKRSIPKAVILSISDSFDNENLDEEIGFFDQQFSKLMSYIGDQMLDLEIYNSSPVASWMTLYEKLEGWANLMPNLESLKIKDHDRQEYLESVRSFKAALKRGHLCQFPFLMNLKNLHVYGEENPVFFLVLEEVLRAGREIKDLKLLGKRDELSNINAMLIRSLPLTCLSTNFYSLVDPSKHWHPERYMDNWHLMMISLDFCHQEAIYMSKVFQFLEENPFLEFVYLSLNDAKIMEEPAVALRLPSVASFKLRHIHYFEDGLSAPLIFSFSMAPFLTRENHEKLLWTLKTDDVAFNSDQGHLFTLVLAEGGEVTVIYASRYGEVKQVVKFPNLENIRVMKYEGDNVPTVMLTRKPFVASNTVVVEVEEEAGSGWIQICNQVAFDMCSCILTCLLDC